MGIIFACRKRELEVVMGKFILRRKGKGKLIAISTILLTVACFLTYYISSHQSKANHSKEHSSKVAYDITEDSLKDSKPVVFGDKNQFVLAPSKAHVTQNYIADLRFVSYKGKDVTVQKTDGSEYILVTLALNDNFKRTLELLTEDGKYNYVAYLLADENGNSIKVAKYSSLDRCDLVENNEYGYCSLIKATKSVLSKLDIENKVAATITPMERIETPLWNKVALREAVINAIVHNDYSFEVPPKFEIFPDRLEITSAGRLPESLTREEFFNGISIPRNKELMRIYRDVELVESLGSGIPRILRAYGEDCFKFTDNFIRITLPISVQDGTQSAPSRHPVGTQSVPNIENLDKLIVFCTEARSFGEMLAFMGLADRTKFRRKYIRPLLEAGILEQTIPNKPKSQNQKYCLTAKGIALKNSLTNNK